ncbi:MAG TPA: hypothetical protein VN521_03225 [Negativicutes bacterium]|nr:hypothetical protein [Negativicutes bacterium]
MASQEADELALLALATALALSQGKKAEEVGLQAGFVGAISSILALIAVELAGEETKQDEMKKKEERERLDKRLERIEEELKALKECCKPQE